MVMFMRKLKLFIADMDRDHIQKVADTAARSRRIEIAGTATNGFAALKAVAACRPDVVMTDVQMPGLDGIMLLKDLCGMSHPPASIVCTRFYSEVSVINACKYGAQCFLYKPIDYNRLPEIILECHYAAQQLSRPQSCLNRRSDPARLAAAIRAMLSEHGIPAKLSGSLYLTESLMLLYEDAALMRNLSKGVFARVAERLDTTPARIERDLRNAIAVAYERGGLSSRLPRRPTVKEFLEYLLASLPSLDLPPEPSDDVFLF